MKLSESEWTVMAAIWERSPASVRDVHERVEAKTGWAYTTVKTMLGRLEEKGAVRSRKRANAGLYEPLVTRGECRRSALRALLDRAFDGTFGTLIQHMAREERLTKRDREKLATMLEDLDRETK